MLRTAAFGPRRLQTPNRALHLTGPASGRWADTLVETGAEALLGNEW